MLIIRFARGEDLLTRAEIERHAGEAFRTLGTGLGRRRQTAGRDATLALRAGGARVTVVVCAIDRSAIS